MAVTLRMMLSMPALDAAEPQVLAGADALDRPVRWVHVTEIDEIGGVLGGHEVVLTTGLPLSGPPSAADRFLQRLAEADSCGLVVELGPRLPAMPRSVVEAAERHGVPLVVLHKVTRFVAVTESVHRLIVGEHYQGLEFAQRTHEVFTALSLDSADAATIVDAAAGLVEGPVVLEDLGHRVLAVAAEGREPRSVLDGWEEASRATPRLDEAGTGGPRGWLTCPVGLRGSPWGRLVAPYGSDDPTRDAMVLQRAAQALQISRLVERDRAGLHVQAQESLLQELADGRVAGEADAAARSRALGVRPTGTWLPVVALFGAGTAGDQIVRQRRARSHLDAVARAVGGGRLHGLVGGLADDAVGILLVTGEHDEDRLLGELVAALGDSASAARLDPPVVGVGRTGSSLLTAASQLRPTVHVAEAARALPPSELRWFRSTDVRLRGLLAQLRDDERLVAFVESELAPLLVHESAGGRGSLDLLRAYIRLRGSKAAVAQELGISRPALYARLRKLEDVLSIDLDDADSLLSLAVALAALDLRGTRPAR